MNKQIVLNINNLYVFKRWSRLPYAVFRSMKKVIKIAFIIGATVLLNAPEKAYSQQDTIRINNHLNVDEIIVRGERAPEAFSKISRIVSLLPEVELNRMPAQSLQDVLEYTPAVDLRVRGKHGVQADLSIRGGSFDQNVILLNGINITDPQTGHLSLSLPVEIDNIQQVEILQGPSSRIVGANAFSGAVNFVTPVRSNNQVNLNAMFGTHNLYKFGVDASLNNKYLNNYVAFSVKGSDGYIDNTDFRNLNMYYNGRAEIENTEILFQVGLTDKAFGSNSFYGSKYKNQYEENKASIASIGFKNKGKVTLSANTYWRRLNDHFVLIRDMPEVYQNFHLTDVVGANSNATLQSFIGKTTIGAELRNETIHSNNLGYDTGDTIAVPGVDTIYFDKFHSRQNIGIFVEHSYHNKNIHISAGGYYNHNSDQGLAGKFYPGIDFSVNLYQGLKAYSSVNYALRIPTFTDLFYQGPTNVGNTNLKPEEATTYEIGLKYLSNFMYAHASFFYRQGKNIIDWVWQDDIEKWHTMNHTELNTFGTEWVANINLSKVLPNSNFWFRNVKVGYAFLNVDKVEGEFESNYALDQLKHKFTFGFDYKVWDNLYLNVQNVYQDRNGNYLDYNFETEVYDQVNYSSFMVMDTRLYWEGKMIKPYVEVSNVFDEVYIDLGGVPQPGRWFRGGIKFTLDFN